MEAETDENTPEWQGYEQLPMEARTGVFLHAARLRADMTQKELAG